MPLTIANTVTTAISVMIAAHNINYIQLTLCYAQCYNCYESTISTIPVIMLGTMAATMSVAFVAEAVDTIGPIQQQLSATLGKMPVV